MTGGSSGGGGVPPGFRFHPTDEELLHFYLRKKVACHKFDMEVISEVDLNKIEPWELQEKCKIGSTPQHEWYFFSHKDRKYPAGSRTNRATGAGFWKATGRDKCIRNSFKKIGMVLYEGRATHGQKTDWIMHECRIEEADQDSQTNQEDEWVVCRVFKKKHLFKVGNSEGRGHVGETIMTMSAANSSDHISIMSSQSLFSHRNNDLNHYLPDHPNCSHIPTPQVEAQNFLPTHDQMISNPGNYTYHHNLSGIPNAAAMENMQIKQFILNNDDCESTNPADQSAQQMVVVAPSDDQNLNHWDGLVLTGSHQQDANSSSPINQINQLSLRSEMDFWGYGK